MVGSDGKKKSKYYANILKSILLSVDEVLFIDYKNQQNENDLIHTSDRAKDFLTSTTLMFRNDQLSLQILMTLRTFGILRQ